jgi:isopropylmalate/homocitrate/citramalate synthase
MEMGFEFPEITTWIRAADKDFELVKDIGVKETGILVSCSDYHIFKKMKMTRRQALDYYLSIVEKCIERGIRPRCHFEDITRADFYGFVVPFVFELERLAEDSGLPIKIRACDTMGYGIPLTGVAMPRSVPGLIYGLRHHARVPSEMIEWHGHNDFYGATMNSMAAWLYGASGVNCSLLGIGERTGNTPLEAMVIAYAQFKGTLDGMDTLVITEIADYYKNVLHYPIPPQTPFTGANFNLTRAGIHADGLIKDEEIYNAFDTQKLLNRPVKVSVSQTSGAAGIAHWLKNHFDLQETPEKTDPLVVRLKEWVDSEYAGGRSTIISEYELEKRALDWHEEIKADQLVQMISRGTKEI